MIGGLGSAVCDVLCEEAPTKVLKIGVNDVFGESGPALELLHKYELDAEGIYKKVKAFVKQAEILEILKEIRQSKKNYLLFSKYMEALIAFHKYYGGKEQ